ENELASLCEVPSAIIEHGICIPDSLPALLLDVDVMTSRYILTIDAFRLSVFTTLVLMSDADTKQWHRWHNVGRFLHFIGIFDIVNREVAFRLAIHNGLDILHPKISTSYTCSVISSMSDSTVSSTDSWSISDTIPLPSHSSPDPRYKVQRRCTDTGVEYRMGETGDGEDIPTNLSFLIPTNFPFLVRALNPRAHGLYFKFAICATYHTDDGRDFQRANTVELCLPKDKLNSLRQVDLSECLAKEIHAEGIQVFDTT
ncbi:hypothetical protein BT69DRAFT_1380465, partial [Atractiella rhizophila]